MEHLPAEPAHDGYGYFCTAKKCPGDHAYRTTEKCVDAPEEPVQTVFERPGYFRGAKISKPVNRGQKS